MEIQLNVDKVRQMAKKLQKAAQPALTYSGSLEVLSTLFGHPNWDTLSGILKSEAHQTASAEAEFWAKAEQVGLPKEPPVLQKPFTLVWAAYAVDEYGDSPAWAKIEVTQDLLSEIYRRQVICIKDSLTSVVVGAGVDEWEQDDNFRIQDEQLNVSTWSLWVEGWPKHVSYHVETRAIQLSTFYKVVLSPGTEDTKNLAWADGVLFAAPEAKELAYSLLESGDIDIDESRVDSMPSA